MKIYILQGSVATQLRCAGTRSGRVMQIFSRLCWWKNFENRSIFGEDMDIKLAAYFLALPV